MRGLDDGGIGMSWTTEVAGRRFVLTDEQMIPGLMEQFRMGNERVANTFADWVNEEYTPWEALESTHDAALELWAQHLVHDRPDLSPGCCPL